MTKGIGIALLVIGLALGIYAVTQSDDDKAELNIGGLELSAENKSASNRTTVLYIIAGICVVAGVGVVSRKGS